MSRSITRLAALLLASGPALAQQAGAPAAGERVAGQCRACHAVNAVGRNGVGPNLHGVAGRKAASVEGFRYPNAMKEKGVSVVLTFPLPTYLLHEAA
ncbi:cytochrome c family protein [Roseicella sp. DB1501]|uniref:c-type cytochrome n=1 Tax=Roseicella sp. DB1501 TaxID=2730925 RepID=UPI0014913603|nr:c-type cytochrome [Roseicella sp. DB1501]NOG74133.1 cytochrome c family protein [Roseicella sp. DB1501]